MRELLEKTFGKRLEEALWEDPAELARKIIKAHEDGELSTDDLDRVVRFLGELRLSDPYHNATRGLLHKYLDSLLRDDEVSREVVDALKMGEDPIERILNKYGLDALKGWLPGIGGTRKRVTYKGLVKRTLRKILENHPRMTRKGIRLSDVLHTFLFALTYSQNKPVRVLIARKNGSYSALIDLETYINYVIRKGSTPVHRAVEVFYLLDALRREHKEHRGEKPGIFEEKRDFPHFIEANGEFLPLTREFYEKVLRPYKLGLGFLFGMDPKHLRRLLNKDPDEIRERIRLLEELGIPANYLFSMKPSSIRYFLFLNGRTIVRKARSMERVTGKSIRELVKDMKPNEFAYYFIRRIWPE